MNRIFIILFSSSLLVASFNIFAEEKESLIISCDGAPKDAQLSLPAPLSEWATLRCSIYGHLITPADGWVWSHSGGFFPVMFPAQMVRSNPKEVGHGSYYKFITLESLEGNEANESIQAFSKNFDTSGGEKPTVYKLTAKNESGGAHTVYFFYSDSRNIWGYACSPTCRPEMPFMVLNMGSK